MAVTRTGTGAPGPGGQRGGAAPVPPALRDRVPPPPPAQHLVVRYAKRGKMRFASHRDVGRAIERGVRRAGLPIAHSSGFTPHPKISYASGTPTSVASEAEYLSLALSSPRDPGLVRSALDAALPDGIDVIEVAEHAGGTLTGRLTASLWRMTLPGVPPAQAAEAARVFLDTEQVWVERDRRNKGVRRLDARAAVVTMELDRRACAAYPNECGTLRMVVRHTEPAVRPEDVLTALRQAAGVSPTAPAIVTRLAQGRLAAGMPGEDGLLGDEDMLTAAREAPGIQERR